MAAPVNYSTSIAASKTVAEMQTMLAEHGAQRIAVDYDNGRASSLTFSLMTQHGMRLFTLPVSIDKMHGLLLRKDNNGELRSGSRAMRTSREQAERVAWRIMKDWLAAQLALIDSEMADLTQVMLPYVRVSETHTLYQAWANDEMLAIEA